MRLNMKCWEILTPVSFSFLSLPLLLIHRTRQLLSLPFFPLFLSSFTFFHTSQFFLSRFKYLFPFFILRACIPPVPYLWVSTSNLQRHTTLHTSADSTLSHTQAHSCTPRISTHTHTHTHTHTQTHTHTHMHAHTCTHTYAHTRAHT